MKNKPLLLLIFLTSLLLTSCFSGRRALHYGDYYTATLTAVSRLRAQPKHQKSQQVLLQAYPLAKETALRNIQNILISNNPDKYALIVDKYLALNELADAIYTCPKALELIPNPTQYFAELKEANNLAAEEAYRQGMDALKKNTILDARAAYFHFLNAEKFIRNYKDVHDKIQESLYIGTLKVVVQKPILPEKFQISADFFYNNLMSKISQVTSNKFIRFYSFEEANKENLKQPDQFLLLDFSDSAVGNIVESRKTNEVSRDSVLVGTTTVNGEKQNVFGTVKAQFTLFRREVISEGVLSVRIIDGINSRILEDKKFPGRYVWGNEWATYKGDERALTKEEKRISNSEPIMPPPQQDLFIAFTKPIFDQTVTYVNYFYSK